MRYYCCCSGGKDSVATIILAHLHNEPLDEVVFAEVMFSQNISGELPEHIEFIKSVLFPKLKEWGIKTQILHSGETYVDWFFHRLSQSKNPAKNGKIKSFPIRGRCIMNSRGKVRAIEKYTKSQGEDAISYVGIAIDEPERLERLNLKEGKISLLEKYGYTEQMAYDLCQEYNLLSPAYKYSKRGGCWFCPNQSIAELKHLYKDHRLLWEVAKWLETVPPHITVTCIEGQQMMRGKGRLMDFEQRFLLEENQIRFDEMEDNNEIN